MPGVWAREEEHPKDPGRTAEQSRCSAVAPPLDRATSEIKRKIRGISEGLATIVSADLTNCHDFIPISDFCSELFICFFFPKAEMSSTALQIYLQHFVLKWQNCSHL